MRGIVLFRPVSLCIFYIASMKAVRSESSDCEKSEFASYSPLLGRSTSSTDDVQAFDAYPDVD